MKKHLLFFVALCFAATAGLSGPALAETGHEEHGKLTGDFLAGYRFVSVNGSEELYRQHLNLDSGPRLFNLDLEYEPTAGIKKYCDILWLDIDNVGGDPYETVSFGFRKYGRYDLRFNHHTSSYYFSNASQIKTGTEDNTYSFDRISRNASLDIRLSSPLTLSLGFDGYQKKGENRIVQPVGEELFLLDQPVEEALDHYHASLRYSPNNSVSLTFQESIKNYKNNKRLFLPGFSSGVNPNDTTELDYYLQQQPYDYKSCAHTLNANASLSEKIDLSVGAMIEYLDLDVDYSATGNGIDQKGQPLLIDQSGYGDISRIIQDYNVDLLYRLSEIVLIEGSSRYSTFSQSGTAAGTVENTKTNWEYDIFSISSAVTAQPHSSLSITFGLQRDVRTVDRDPALTSSACDSPCSSGLFGAFGYVNVKPLPRLTVSADYSFSSEDDTFTLTSPLDNHQGRVKVRYSTKNGYYLQGSGKLQNMKNSLSGWKAFNRKAELVLGFHSDTVELTGGYGIQHVTKEIDQLVTPLWQSPFYFPVVYEGTTHSVHASARVELNKHLSAGCDVDYYTNCGTVSHSALDAGSYTEILFKGHYLLKIAYRHAMFRDKDNSNDYTSNIAEISAGYRW